MRSQFETVSRSHPASSTHADASFTKYLKENDEVVKKVYAKFWPILVGYSRSKGNLDSEAFAQDTFVFALRRHHRAGDMHTLVRILYRRMVWDQSSAYRSASRKPYIRCILPEDEDIAEETCAQGLHKEDHSHLLGSALDRLRPMNRLIVRLRFWEELSHAEIAVRLGLTTLAVRSRFHQALKVLRSHCAKFKLNE